MRIPIPESLARQLADRAVQNCHQDLQGRGWTSARSLSPYAAEGLVGIRTSANYLLYQEKGIRPFLMKWVENRILPMGCSQGDGPHFRRGGHVGEPGYVEIPHRGRVWRQQKWKYPGLKPQKFMENAIRAAIKDAHSDLKAEVMRALRGEYQ